MYLSDLAIHPLTLFLPRSIAFSQGRNGYLPSTLVSVQRAPSRAPLPVGEAAKVNGQLLPPANSAFNSVRASSRHSLVESLVLPPLSLLLQRTW